jgi:hypothetical protein
MAVEPRSTLITGGPRLESGVNVKSRPTSKQIPLNCTSIAKMSGKITCYLDCGMFHCCDQQKLAFILELTCAVSPYSYFALLHLERNIQTLATHSIEVE